MSNSLTITELQVKQKQLTEDIYELIAKFEQRTKALAFGWPKQTKCSVFAVDVLRYNERKLTGESVSWLDKVNTDVRIGSIGWSD
jgi:hypothetical protein